MTLPDGRPMTPFQERLGRVAVQSMTALNIAVYRMSGGRVAGSLRTGAALCLVTTTGRRTGRARTVPLLFIEQDGALVLVASRGGMSAHPAWYLNLREHPEITVQVGADVVAATARDATPDERRRAWPLLVAVYPRFEQYQRRTDREIPLVIVTPDPS
jgi:F420H(2)-dependent quinone reductase